MKNRNLIIARFIFLLLITKASIAQEICTASEQFNGVTCRQSAGKCVAILINTDAAGKKFIYEWSMGDGSTKQGLSIEHCYAEYGVYVAKLRLIDESTGIKIEDEIVKELVISPLPVVTLPEKIMTGQSQAYECTYPDTKDFQVKDIFWQFGNSDFLCGSKVNYAFAPSSATEINALVTGYYKEQLVKVCTKVLASPESNKIEAATVKLFFEQREMEMPDRGRFLNDKVHLLLAEKRRPDQRQHIVLDTLEYNVRVEAEKEYLLYAWKGNFFTTPREFNSGTPAEKDQRLKETVNTLVTGNIYYFHPVTFELDAASAIVDNLKKNIDLLKQYPWLTVAIGIYTHTGGRLSRNEHLAHDRAVWLTSQLETEGIDATRIQTLTSKQDHLLLNTCAGLKNCEVENATLNRRAEFKIVMK